MITNKITQPEFFRYNMNVIPISPHEKKNALFHPHVTLSITFYYRKRKVTHHRLRPQL